MKLQYAGAYYMAMKEMIVDFRKQQREQPPIHIDGTVVERVVS